MYDRNCDNFHTLTETVKLVFFFKTIVGTILLLFGIAIAWEVLQIISTLIQASETIPLVENIIQMGHSGSEFRNQLPASDVHGILGGYEDAVFGYGILIFLLSIAGGIAQTFLGIGAELIKSDLKSLLEKLGEELARLGKSFNQNY
ncbi:hypothetical protein [Planktothricoides raciborskii]|uniref:Uncharacterized protein n=2 Tax=Planktothricoides raciborskii TaxID=132608 RepID=A0AAU8JN11_9CYAN|nr:hypothetical protein [Planktothricoides raciborskii]MBD2543630.1 hypothetical protein [Planktothricoides raciborskii FACHB-1370]MBD2581319.1 hypothetical protein [Planktothricoides raciborskii FACHB-1261]